jgi:hypothetical protein
MVPPVLTEKKPLIFQPTTTVSTIMTSPLTPPWTKVFSKTLSEYVQPWMEAFGEVATRIQIVKECEEAITQSPLYAKHVEELSQDLCLVSISFHKVS